ncbi:hypothetical protein [Paenibacillus sp. NPDC057967]|uniref:hypothetical protein n=1 Tax=Paenibacillus sp. NPDC057967 TaxID=3346293 RepID=UPI0036DD6846
MGNQHVYTLENIKLSKLQGSVPQEKFVLESCTLFIIVHGTGELWLDDQVYPVSKSGKIIYANPGAVVHYKEEGQG